MADIPVVVTAAGATPTPPASLLANLLASVSSTNPGYTANLPGSLIEDISSTDIGALIITDSARVETINSLTPYGANDFLLSQLGQIYIGPGSAPGIPTNTSVPVIITAIDTATSAPLPGLIIDIGFTVSDGTYQYIVQDGGVTDSDGVTPALFCLATVAGSWAVATNTVTQIVTEQPTGVTLSCTNSTPGVAGAAAETAEQYRARVFQGGQAVCTGLTTLLKTALGVVSGVQQRLISVRQQTGGWEVIVGGGDPYEVAGAIMASGLNIAGLVGSILAVTNITQANPGKVTTDLNHGFSTGQQIVMNDIVGMTPLNGETLTIAVVDEKNFTIGVNTTVLPAYVSGGVVTPNLRNNTVNISDPPDIYGVTFVGPPAQNVTIAITWNTTESNFVSQAAVAQLASPAIAAYINAITVGAPISLVVLGTTFAAAVASVLDPETISELNWAVSINGIATSPEAGTQLIFGDPESYFQTTNSGITVNQG